MCILSIFWSIVHFPPHKTGHYHIFQQQEQLQALRDHHRDSVKSHEEEIQMHKESIKRHEEAIDRAKKMKKKIIETMREVEEKDD